LIEEGDVEILRSSLLFDIVHVRDGLQDLRGAIDLEVALAPALSPSVGDLAWPYRLVADVRLNARTLVLILACIFDS